MMICTSSDDGKMITQTETRRHILRIGEAAKVGLRLCFHFGFRFAFLLCWRVPSQKIVAAEDPCCILHAFDHAARRDLAWLVVIHASLAVTTSRPPVSHRIVAMLPRPCTGLRSNDGPHVCVRASPVFSRLLPCDD